MQISADYKVREIAGEHVIVMPGRYGADMTRVVALNASSLYLWNALAGGEEFTSDQVARLLVDEYGIDTHAATRDAEAWVEKLKTCGIVK